MNHLANLLQIKIFNNNILDILIAGAVFLVIYFSIAIFKEHFAKRVNKLVQKTSTKIDDIIFESTLKFFNTGKLIISLGFALNFINFSTQTKTILNKIIIIITTIFITWLVQNITLKIIDEYFSKLSKNLKNSFLPFFKNFLNIFLWITATIFILSNLGYKISSLAAGLGISGLAIALAIRPTLEAFFASLAIFTDKSFQIGDIIKLNEHTGSVKKIGLRSTKIETFFGTEVVIPNTELINSGIENITKRSGQRIDASVGVTYETSSRKLEKGISIIKNTLKSQKEVLEGFRVWFNTFGDFALIISLTYFISTEISYNERMEIISQINLEIKKEFEKQKIDMAYPTQTLYVKKI